MSEPSLSLSLKDELRVMSRLLEQLVVMVTEQNQRLERLEKHIQHLGYIRDHPVEKESLDFD